MTFYVANVIGGEGVRILDAPLPVEDPSEVPCGDEGVVALYGDEGGATVHVPAADEDDAERRIIATFGPDAYIDSLEACGCNEAPNYGPRRIPGGHARVQDEQQAKRETSPLRETPQFKRLAAARAELLAGMDHWPDVDPDELIPRYFESGVALDMLGYVADWDLPEDVSFALSRLTTWLHEEHRGHETLLEKGRIE